MNLQEIGYYVLCLSPLMSLGAMWVVVYGNSAYLLAQLFNGTAMGWRASLIWMTAANAAVNGVQVWGLLLYLAGYRRGPGKLARTVSTRLAAGVLIGWGIVVSLFTYSFYQTEVIQRSLEPGVRALIIWDHLGFATWIMKGVLWVIAGAVIGLTTQARME